MPALIQTVYVPGMGCGFTASRPPRCTDKLGLSLQGPISIPRWGQQLIVATTLQVPLEEASYLLDSFVPQSFTLASLPRTCFGWIHNSGLCTSLGSWAKRNMAQEGKGELGILIGWMQNLTREICSRDQVLIGPVISIFSWLPWAP